MNAVARVESGQVQKVVQSLQQNLADTYALLVNVQGYHWNVEGPDFFALHGAFEDQYRALFAAVDDLAERIRTLGFKVPASLAGFSANTAVKQAVRELSAKEMVIELIDAYEATNEGLAATVELATAQGDEGTAALAGDRLSAQEKTVWMLRAYLGGPT